MSLLVRLSGDAGFSTMEVVFGRSFVVTIVSWFFLKRAGLSGRGRDRRLLVLRSVVGFIALVFFYYALIRLPLADATVIQYTNPIWTAVLAAFFLSEPIGRKEVALSVASLGGVVVMARPTFLFGGTAPALPPGPVAVGVVGAFFAGLAYVSVRRLARTDPPLVVVYWFALLCTIGATPFVVFEFFRDGGSLPDLRGFALLGAVGGATYLGQVLITMGMREEPAGRAMGVAYLQVVFAALWGAIVLTEIPDRWTVAGAGVILGCTWLLGRGRVSPM
jgi:drug/metabolite transporter (DMT)-like permease